MAFELETYTPSCTICPTPIYIITDVDGVDKYVVLDSGGLPQPITQACCQYISNDSNNSEWVSTDGGYCKAKTCEAVIFDGNVNSKPTTEDCCTQQGFYWETSNSRCYKCNENTGTIVSFINGLETVEHISYNSDKEENPITSKECCTVVGGVITIDENGNTRCVQPLTQK